MSDVFVSYARSDRARVGPLVAELERLGFAVYWDRNIPPGQTWEQVLETHLGRAACVLVVWTRDSIESDWVKTEAAEAKERDALVPVLLDEVPIPLEFRRIQTADLRAWSRDEDDGEFGRVVEAIRAASGRAPSPEPPPTPRPRSSWRGFTGIAVAAAALVGVVGWAVLSNARPSEEVGPRVEVALLAYGGADIDDRRRAAFAQFRGILEDKITNLVQDLGHRPALSDPATVARLRQLKVEIVDDPPGSGLDLEQKLRLWRQRNSLGLLTGTLADGGEPDGHAFTVHSQIFIGDLDGSVLGRSIPVTTVIEPGQFRNMRDTHALAVLYALAMDSRRLGSPDAVVSAYLSAARSIAQGLLDMDAVHPIPEAVREIGSRVETELSQMAVSGRTP